MSTSFNCDIFQLGPNVELRHGSAAPTAGGGVAASIGSLYFQSSTSLIWQKMGSGATDWGYLQARDWYGDGSDGDVVVSGATNLARDMYYNSLTVQSGGVVQNLGFRIYVRGDLVIDAGGLIKANGGVGNGGTGAGGSAGATLGPFGQGVNTGGASTTTTGTASANFTEGIPGYVNVGGAGGTGAGGIAGAGGTLTPRVANLGGSPHSLITALFGNQIGGNAVGRFAPGTGGGGGGGTGGAVGGPGGGGGGNILLIARTITNNGEIEAKGGAGTTSANTHGGGGGGGAGGNVITATRFYSGTAPNVAFGAKGAANGTGLAGTDGTIGNHLPVQT